MKLPLFNIETSATVKLFRLIFLYIGLKFGQRLENNSFLIVL